MVQEIKRYLIPVLLVLLVVIAAATLRPSARPALPPVPELAVAEFSRPVREQLRAARARALEAPQDAQRILDLGRILHAYKMLPPAIDCYRRARRLQPGNFESAYLLGIALAQSGDDAGAGDNLRSALALNPDYAPARLRLGEVLFKTGAPDEARDLFEALLARQPDSPWAHHRLAQVLAALGDPAGAIVHNKRAIELYADFGPVHYALALAYRDRGDTELAQEHMVHYRAHPEQAPPHVDPLLETLDALDISARAHVRRARQFDRAGQPQVALQSLQQAVAIEPQSVEAHSELIRLYHRFDDIEQAARHYRAVTAIEPYSVMANLEYGNLLAEHGRMAEAATAFEKVLEADSEHSDAHAFLGQAREELQQPEVAEREYRLALTSNPNNRRAALLLGRLLLLKNRYAEAEPLLSLAGQGGQVDSAFYLQRIARVYHEAGQPERALSVLETARTEAATQGQQRLLEEIRRTQAQWRGAQ